MHFQWLGSGQLSENVYTTSHASVEGTWITSLVSTLDFTIGNDLARVLAIERLQLTLADVRRPNNPKQIRSAVSDSSADCCDTTIAQLRDAQMLRHFGCVSAVHQNV